MITIARSLKWHCVNTNLKYLYLRLSSELEPLRILSKPMLMWFYASETDICCSNQAPHDLNRKPDNLYRWYNFQSPVTVPSNYQSVAGFCLCPSTSNCTEIQNRCAHVCIFAVSSPPGTYSDDKLSQDWVDGQLHSQFQIVNTHLVMSKMITNHNY